jgi:hypothetical protein
MDSKYVCPCGLVCADCLFYKKEFFEAANQLQRLIAEYRFDVFYGMLSRQEVAERIATHLGGETADFRDLFAVFEKMPDFLQVLEGVVKVQCSQTCRESGGCTIGGLTRTCAVVGCVAEKDLEGCWQCAEHETCAKLSFQRASYGETIRGNFETLKAGGTGALDSRGNQYYEWQRKITVRKPADPEAR